MQYGLQALRAGAITKAQFLDLNERIGGYDQDANFVAGRSVGHAAAIGRACQSGLQYGGNGGTARAKTVRNKPTTAGCYTSLTTFVAEPQTFSSLPNSTCDTLLPSYGASQLVADGPVSAGILKCQLKPVTARWHPRWPRQAA